MNGHEGVKTLVRDYLATWVPIRLELIRQLLEVAAPEDPNSYLLLDHLPQNDPSKYPAVVVMSTKTVDMTRRKVTSSGEIAVFDVDYEVTVVVATEHNEFADDETAVIHRDRLLLAIRECILLPAALDDSTEILQSPLPVEVTGAAAETLRGNALAAGQIVFYVRSTETLMPTSTLVDIVGGDVTVTAYDETSTTIPAA
ncbi:MAG: hypothetical protein QG661_2081 [Actinomycetota bacterium]|jgi:hypothetical protein|nr:hypothetical protein [Actinomycetota bacterium]